jgi:hypothetical protein
MKGLDFDLRRDQLSKRRHGSDAATVGLPRRRAATMRDDVQCRRACSDERRAEIATFPSDDTFALAIKEVYTIGMLCYHHSNIMPQPPSASASSSPAWRTMRSKFRTTCHLGVGRPLVVAPHSTVGEQDTISSVSFWTSFWPGRQVAQRCEDDQNGLERYGPDYAETV